MSSLQKILKQFWNYDSFRPMQEEIILSVLEGKDTLAVLPTGAGKSMCYQLPAMARDGLCLVISPLIALMKDQVQQLRRKNITAFAIYSGMSWKEVQHILHLSATSNCKFLYLSPERLETNLFREYLPSLDINLIAVDEAHCISQWGYDFRPPYLRIVALRDELQGIPVLAVTASATLEVQQDICDKLQFKDFRTFQMSFERPNLSYSVFRVDSKISKIREVIQKTGGSSIVYCKTRRKTKEISDQLRADGFSSDFYHAGLQREERTLRHDAWIKNKTGIIVCTNAFGMGIDKPGVRSVVHADPPDCLENYYQEAGRAGRDGEEAYAVLLYQEQELEEMKRLPDTRYPSPEKISIIYQALVNYLQLPAGSGEGIYYDFELNDFVKKFKSDLNLVLYSLKALEQESIVSFSEKVFLPSRIGFTAGKAAVNQIEQDHPSLEPVINLLLRNYPGIVDRPVPVYEKKMAGLLHKQPEEVLEDLRKLQCFGMIEYFPQKDSPQLYFIQDRVRGEDLQINRANHQKRKDACAKRVDNLLAYVKSEKECRSRFLAHYFGEENPGDCGICDNCRRKKKSY